MNARKLIVIIAFSLILLMVVGTVALRARAASPSSDMIRDALMALYYSTDGETWGNNTGWGSDLHYCDGWYGVYCDEEDHVVSIWMYEISLSGTLPPELGNLVHLRSLILGWYKIGDHNLSGPIPPELGKLSELRFLNLSGNILSGPIPPELGNLSKLGQLWLQGNNLSGPIPQELGNLSNLRELFLSWNNLSGHIPSQLGRLSRLDRLWLQGNNLSGPIPAELSNLSDLSYLLLDYNSCLICWETEAARDWALDLGPYEPWNWIGYSGPNAVCSDVYLGLMGLYASTDGENWTNNGGWVCGSGDFCPWYGVVCDGGHVTKLELRSNNLRGRIPSELSKVSSLKGLNLAANSLYGPIPSTLAELNHLETLYLQKNQGLVCWETEAARDWALEPPPDYLGPDAVCSFLYLPLAKR